MRHGALIICSAIVAAIACGLAGICWQQSSIVYPKVYTADQLQQHDGSSSKQILLAVLGRVYDVSSGSKHYGPHGAYRSLAARDATTLLATGEWSCSKDCDRVDDLDDSDLLTVRHWHHFFAKKYKSVGVLAGRYYTADGRPTAELTDALKRVEHAVAAEAAADAAREKSAQGDMQAGTPHASPSDASVEHSSSPVQCNVRLSATGREYWCQGDKLPRRVPAVEGHSVHEKCFCVNQDDLKTDAAYKAYQGCDTQASSCSV